MSVQSPPLNRVFQALSDPTRLEVVKRLSNGPASATELARPFDMALPSFTQHLRMLEDYGLVLSEKRGRVRTYQLASDGLKAAEDWMAGLRRTWERRLDQLDEYLLELKEKQ